MNIIAILVALLVQTVGYAFFCKGFFPTKVLLSENELSKWRTELPEDRSIPDAKFSKVVFMVVDAMRADFLFSDRSNMGFSHWLLNEGFGLGFTAFSNPPTVTLPRLKGITTGSTPNFIDAVLNIAEDDTSSTLGDQDSWIKQMYLHNWKINMFGDDTWLKLFPDYFHKTDGTASFYVSDFTIVDNNVTRHLDHELSSQDDWNCMILHYLGLDHIGHKGGANSMNMPIKQLEMDNIIKKIFQEAIVDHPETLFVVMGDHGMNDVGNHGGSSTGETSAAMMLISEQFKHLKPKNKVNAPIPWNEDYEYFSKIDQIDLVPTLTELLGLPVPINNLGNFVPLLLDLYETEEEKVDVLLKNALQLKVLLDKSNDKIAQLPDLTVNSLLQYIENAKQELSKSSSNYNDQDIYIGLGLSLFITLVSFLSFGLYFREKFHLAFFDVVFFFTYSATFIASSFVEEEHHMWWFFSTIFLTYHSIKAVQSDKYKVITAVIMFTALRLMKAWNTSGQKYNLTSVWKISSWISTLPANTGPNYYLGLLSLTNLFVVIPIDMFGQGLTNIALQGLICVIAFMLSCSKILSYLTACFDMASDQDFPPWVSVFIDQLHAITGLEDYNKINNLLFSSVQKLWIVSIVFILLRPRTKTPESNSNFFNSLLSIVTLILISQTNYANVPLFCLMFIILHCSEIILEPGFKNNTFNLFIIIMQNSTFFLFGSTNSISTVDLTNSFNGLSSYNMFLSGLLTYVCNWAGPLFWTIASMKLALGNSNNLSATNNKWQVLKDKMIFNMTFYAVAGLVLLGCCFHLRFHLFVWTVFSPKILYFASWLLCNLFFDSLLCIVITALF